MPKVSVLLSSYNHSKFVGESIESVLNQTFKDFDLTIIDDCSTDNSWEIIKRYDDPRINAVRLESNSNCAYFEPALLSLDGEYVAVAHCDDKWMPEKLQKQVDFLDSHANYEACFTAVQVIDEDGCPADEHDLFAVAFKEKNRTRFEWLNSFLYDGCGLCHPSILIRKAAYTKYDLCTSGLDSIPDFCKWIRLCCRADIYLLEEKLSCFRARKGGANTSGDAPEKHYRNNSEMFFVLGEFLRITDPLDFVNAFPAAEKYLIDGEMIIPFAFARILLDTMNMSVYHLFGLKLIYDLVQDKNTVNRLRDMYGYTLTDFNLEKQKHDVFSVIGAERFISVRLHVDMGNGFNADDCLELSGIYVDATGSFAARFNVEQFNAKGKIKALRFDPDKGIFRAYKDVSLLCGGKEATLASHTPLAERDGWDFFCTPFVEYVFQGDFKSYPELVFSGKTKKLTGWDMNELISDLSIPNEMFLQFSKRIEIASFKNAQFINALNSEISDANAKFEQHVNYLKKHKLKSIIKILLGRSI